MAFKEVEKEPETERIPPFWKPEQIGDSIEGNIYDFEESTFNGRKQVQISLYCGEDEDGEAIMSLLPAHADLKRVYSNINVGDFIHVEVSEIIKAKSRTGNDKFIYKVLVDDDRFIEFPSEDENSDDYYE